MAHPWGSLHSHVNVSELVEQDHHNVDGRFGRRAVCPPGVRTLYTIRTVPVLLVCAQGTCGRLQVGETKARAKRSAPNTETCRCARRACLLAVPREPGDGPASVGMPGTVP